MFRKHREEIRGTLAWQRRELGRGGRLGETDHQTPAEGRGPGRGNTGSGPPGQTSFLFSCRIVGQQRALHYHSLSLTDILLYSSNIILKQINDE